MIFNVVNGSTSRTLSPRTLSSYLSGLYRFWLDLVADLRPPFVPEAEEGLIEGLGVFLGLFEAASSATFCLFFTSSGALGVSRPAFLRGEGSTNLAGVRADLFPVITTSSFLAEVLDF
jgi:hypothetical protein